MPDHSSWLTLILRWLRDHIGQTLDHNAQVLLGPSVLEGNQPTMHSWEPLMAAVFVALLLIGLSLRARSQLVDADKALVPEDRLTLRTFAEIFLGYFYDLSKSVMGAERAKKYFHVVAGSAVFVFCANLMALVPGMPVATSSLNITFGCAAVVFVLFNLYGLKENGFGYIKHLAGPVWYLSWLILPIEIISLIVRPITLAVRLMLNMAVDHLLLSIIMGIVAIALPLPLMLLGCLIIVVQTLVFTILTCIYIGLATEHEEAH